jgi:Asp/Glu/hydantoin racemase
MSEPKLAVLNTVTFLADRFKGMIAARYPGLDSFQMLDESLLQDLIRQGPSDAITARVVGHVRLAEAAGATAVLFTCSSTSPAVDVARREVDIPIIKIDDAMAECAVLSGTRIGLLCTTPSTRGPSSDLIRAHAERLGRSITIVADVQHNAYHALMAGDRDRHDELVSAAAGALAQHSEVIVLAQASLAHLQASLTRDLGLPVLASPDLCVEALGSQIGLGPQA